MNEIPTVMLRRNKKQIIGLLCFMLLMGVVAMQQPNYLPQTEMREVDKTPLAGINKHFEETLDRYQFESINSDTDLTAGISKHLMDVLKEKSKDAKENAVIEKKFVGKVITTSAETTETIEMVEMNLSANEAENEEIEQVEEPETEIPYKSIEEVQISRDMNLTETTGLSQEDFYKLLTNFKYDYAGFYERNANLIWDLSQEYQVNEIFLCGVFALESYYGSDKGHVSTHNYGSIMNKHGKLVVYENDAEGIEANYKLFANCYLAPEGKYYKGVTLDSIGDTYCPPTSECPSWADKVYCCMKYFLE